MPEPVQLLLGCREWGRRTMAETDDGDACDEIEVLVPRIVPDTAAFATDDREIDPGVRRQHGIAQRRQRLWL